MNRRGAMAGFACDVRVLAFALQLDNIIVAIGARTPACIHGRLGRDFSQSGRAKMSVFAEFGWDHHFAEGEEEQNGNKRYYDQPHQVFRAVELSSHVLMT